MTALAAAPPSEAVTETQTAADYVRGAGRKIVVLSVLGILLLAAAAGDLLVGGAPMPLGVLVTALTDPGSAAAIDVQIVWDIRLPMTLTAVLVGAALAAAGAQMQTILGNPLAEPYTLGIASAASFGAALAVVSGFTATTIGTALGIAGSAWFFAMLACAAILLFARLRGPGAESMILIGIAIVFFFDALLALMQYLASVVELEQVVFWTLGSLSRATWPQIGLLTVVLAASLVILLRQAWTLTAFRMGDDRAQALGIAVSRVRMRTLIIVSVLAATAVSMAGTIGFIGLVGPHVARMLAGEDQRFFLPAAALSGALLLTAASLASKLIQPGLVLPVGIITAVVGVPVFLLLILSRRKRIWS